MVRHNWFKDRLRPRFWAHPSVLLQNSKSKLAAMCFFSQFFPSFFFQFFSLAMVPMVFSHLIHGFPMVRLQCVSSLGSPSIGPPVNVRRGPGPSLRTGDARHSSAATAPKPGGSGGAWSASWSAAWDFWAWNYWETFDVLNVGWVFVVVSWDLLDVNGDFPDGFSDILWYSYMCISYDFPKRFLGTC